MDNEFLKTFNATKYGSHILERPDYLYHYTSIKGLAHILKSRKIRFTPLTEKDDKLECIVDELQHIRKYVFSSSWTDLTEESIPFWSMYTDNMRGVRIKLPTTMFADSIIHLTPKKLNGVQECYVSSMLPESTIFGTDYYISPVSINHRFALDKVHYQEKNNIESCVESVNNGTVINFGNWGIIKTKEWQFQSEWRFRLLALPIDYSNPKAFENSLSRMVSNVDVSINELYVDICKDAFAEMEILLGPKCDDGDRILVDALIDKFNPNTPIDKSTLLIR